MRKLSLILGWIFMAGLVIAQENPHGETLQFSCTDCHTTEGWTFSKETAVFSHDLTDFELEGQHIYADCGDCHNTLVFSEAQSNCIDCHTDMHKNTVGLDCARCHDSRSWIVENITEMHQTSRFPLLGAHNTTDCSTCHTAASNLEFQPLGVECIDCHRQDYQATTNPNHIEAGISTDCIECHKLEAHQWTSAGFNHDFFPLTKGHATDDCAACHTNGLFEPVSSDCYSCHEQDFNAATNPSHQNSGFTTTCTDCHTTDPDWKPAKFEIHDTYYFPIFSGEHRGEWVNCSECHSQSENYGVFTCTDCHEHNRSEMDDEHDDVNGYTYSSPACFACHPLGREEGSFNHEATGFPLKGAHIQTSCLDCHENGFSSTISDCSSCHTNDYSQANDPNHLEAGISQTCEPCHDENGWSPSLFDHTSSTSFELTGGHSNRTCSDCHQGTTSNASSECISCHQENYNNAENHVASNYPYDCLQCHTVNTWDDADFDHNATNFALTGAHIATECAACHTDGYAGTSTLCNSCHNNNYNEAQNPSHSAAGISTECENCHETSAWVPSNFDHTATTGFELIGGHSGRTCADCHQGTTSNSSSECISCHQENYNNAENHVVSSYPYDCLQCHTVNTWDDADFDHNATNFALTGAHIATECAACHTDGYAGTSTLCNSCHQTDYNETTNPNHSSLGLATGCDDCHTTNPGWEPALFPNHNDYYALNGAHATVAENCFLCHEGNYTGTPNTCFSCHESDYNNTTDPSHSAAQFPTDCQSCHTESAWTPSTFDHDGQYFPIYSGEHRGEWNSCSDCHTQPTNFAVFSCITCHEHNQAEMDSQHNDVSGYSYNSASCLACHPNGSEDDD